MAEVFGIVTGVIGVVSSFLDQVEQFVKRCQAVTENPTTVKSLASECTAIHSRLVQFQRDLSRQDTQQPAAGAFDVFRPAVEDAKRYFESAQRDLEKLERKFPPLSTSTGPDRFRKVWYKCRQFVLANKFVGGIESISENVDKAKMVLDPLFHQLEAYITLKDTNVTVKETLETVKMGASAHVQKNSKDEFKPQFMVPAMLPGVVLDFSSRDDDGKPVTMEGKLKKALLHLEDPQNDTGAIAVAVGAAGMGGVGKTTALIGLGWEGDLRDRFRDGGIYYVSVGKDASKADVIKKLGHVMRSTGGNHGAERVLKSESLSGAVAEVTQWFEGRGSLFLFDDLWEREDSEVGYLADIRQLLSSCTRTKMVISTRSEEIALDGGKRVKFGPREPHGNESRRILIKHAGVCTESVLEIPEASKEALESVLRRCGGVPLTLGVAGRAIQEMSLSCSGNWAEAVVVYARDLEAEISNVGNKKLGEYPSFDGTLRTSVGVADRWCEKYELRLRTGEQVSCSQLFNALCVLERQGRAPREMLKRLWCITEDRVIHEVVRKFADLNLISEERRSDGGSAIMVHDLVLEYCQRAAGTRAQAYHAGLLNEYLPSDEDVPQECVTEGSEDLCERKLEGTSCRSWWDFESDAYMSDQVCRHLVKAGCVDELVCLLSDFRWTEARVRSGELLSWQEDFGWAFGALKSCEQGMEKMEEGLQKIRDAAQDGWGFAANNVVELPFQMQSRMHLHDDETASWVRARYMKSLEEHAKKPWLRCHERCWPDPGVEQGAMMYLENGVREIKVAKEGEVGVAASGRSAVIIDMERRCVIDSVVHDSDVEAVTITPDGSEVVSISRDGTMGIWNRTKREAVYKPLHGYEESSPRCIEVSEDGSRIVSGSDDGTVKIYDGRNGKAVCEPLHAHEGSVNCVGVSANGSRIVSGSRDGTVRIYDGRNGEAVCEPLHAHDDEVMCVGVSGDGSRIVSGLLHGTVKIYDGRNGEAVCEPLHRHKGWVECVGVSTDGSRIVSGSWDGTVKIYDGRNGEALCEPLHAHEGSVVCVGVSADGSRIVSGSSDGTVKIYGGRNGEAVCEPLHAHEGSVMCVGVSEDGSRIVSGSRDGTVKIYDGRNGEAVYEPLHAHERWVNCVGVSANGSRIVSGSEDGTVKIYDGRNGEAVCEPLHAHERWVRCVEVSADGSRIVSGSRDGTVRIYDGRNGEAVCEPLLHAHDDEVMCVGVSADGSRIVSGSFDGTVKIYDGRNGKAVCEPLLHARESWVTCVGVSADGSRIVSGSWDGTVKIYDGRNGKAVCEPLHGHDDEVWCVGVSANGSRIVSGSLDGTVKIYDGRNGEAVCEPLHAHNGIVNCVGVSGDGSRIVSGSSDGTVRRWDWNGVSFEGTVVFEGDHVYSIGEGVGASTRNGQEKIWRRNVEGELVEVEMVMWHEPRGRASSAHGFTNKWHVYVRERQVFARSSEDEDSIVIGTLPSERKYDYFNCPGFQGSQDDGEDSNTLGPFVVLLRNSSVLTFSLQL